MRSKSRLVLVAAALALVSLLAPGAAMADTDSCGGRWVLGKGDCTVGAAGTLSSVTVSGDVTALQVASVTVTAYEWLGEGPFGPVLGQVLATCTSDAAFPVAQAACSQTEAVTITPATPFVFCLVEGSFTAVGTFECELEFS